MQLVNDAQNAITSLRPIERKIPSVQNVKKRMKMFNTQNDGEQITKLNSRVTDLHDAYRVLLQNVNNLRKEMDEYCRDYELDRVKETIDKLQNKLDEKCSFKVHLKISDQVDYVENEQQRLETKMINDHQDLNWKIKQLENKIEDKTLADVKEEATSTNPGEVYLQAKDKVLAAMDYLLDTDVGHFEFSNRAMNCLGHRRITTMRNLISFSEKSLHKTNNLGTRTLIEIKSVLAKYDLKLREEGDFDDLDELQEKLKYEKD